MFAQVTKTMFVLYTVGIFLAGMLGGFASGYVLGDDRNGSEVLKLERSVKHWESESGYWESEAERHEIRYEQERMKNDRELRDGKTCYENAAGTDVLVKVACK